MLKFRKIFGRNSLEGGNLNLLAPHFLLFQQRLSVPYSLAPRAAAGLARPRNPAPVLQDSHRSCRCVNRVIGSTYLKTRKCPYLQRPRGHSCRTYRPYAAPKRRIPTVHSPSVTSPNGTLSYIAAKNSKPASTAIFINTVECKEAKWW